MATIDVTTTPAQALPRGNRHAAILQNLSDTDIYVSSDPGVTAADGPYSGLRIKADGGTLAIADVASNKETADRAIYAVHAGSGVKALRYVQF